MTKIHRKTSDESLYDAAVDTFTSEGGFVSAAPPVEAPSDADRKLMALMTIHFEAGAYRFETFRYDRLSDAVKYAEFAAQRPRDGGPL